MERAEVGRAAPATLTQSLQRVPAGYKVLETVYRSSSKVVYRAQREADALRVVLKCLDKPSIATRKRMEREVSFLRRLHGTGVCTEVVDFLQDEGVIILTDHGGAVGSILLDDDAPVDTLTDVRALLQIALQLSSALNVVHGHRICHNDMKPRNFLYLHDAVAPRIILLDFDLASNFDEAASTSSAVGTVEYMSPEQTGQLALARDYRTDLYSLGVVLYQLATGKLPYSGANVSEVFHATISTQPDPVATVNTSIPLVLSNIIMTLLNKNPDQRYQSAFGLAWDLQRCLTEWGVMAIIPMFTLRERDCPVVFRIPRGIFGREAELSCVQTVYENTRSGRKPRYLLVSGPAGVGKSAILSTLQSGFPGTFIVGKYEHNRGETPNFAFVQAINMLARHLLLLPSSELLHYRAQILTAVGANGAVLTSIFHDLERVIGQQPPVPDLPPSEAQNRLKTVFLTFIRVFAALDRPLLLFLDDMHWADSSSLVLWRSLLTAEVPGLMVVCAYRDNEVPAGHPFDLAINEVVGAGVLIERMHLMPIASPAIVSILTTAIKISAEEALPLAELLLQKTLGNPFFLNRYIKALYEENLLHFDWRLGKWTYDTASIASSVLAENAAQLMTESLRKLDPLIRDPLLQASCIGSQFSLTLLSVVSNQSEEDLHRSLIAAVDQAYIFKVSVGQFKFCHDNVHTAAYALLGPEDKKSLHLQLGRAMLRLLSPTTLDDSLFDVLAQLNAGSSLITDPSELLRLAELNRSGTQLAIRATATATAFEYACAGLEALARAEPQMWSVHHRLAFELALDRASALALTNRLPEALESFTQLSEYAQTPSERIEVFTPKMLHLHMAGKQREACEVGIRGLEALGGKSLPIVPTDTQVDTYLAEFDTLMQSRTFDQLAQTPAATDPMVSAQQRCLGNMTAASFFYSPNFCAIVSAHNAILGLKQGLTPYTGIGLVFLAMVYGLREKFDVAFEVGRLAVAVVDRFEDLNYKGRVYFMYGAHINWFRKPLLDDLTYLRVACRYLLSTYDYTYASYAHAHLTLTHLLGNDSLDSALFDAKLAREVLRSRIHAPHMLCVLEVMVQVYTMLTLGASAVQNFFFATPEVLKLEQSILNDTTPLTVSWWLCTKVFGLYCLEKYEDAVAAGKLNEGYVSSVRGHLVLPHWHYAHYALSILAVCAKTTEAARVGLLDQLRGVLASINSFARNSPVNLGYIEKVVIARYKEVIDHDFAAASSLYDEAVAEAERARSMYWHGLGLSLAGGCAAAKGHTSFSRLLLREAATIFTQWGAATLVALISRHHSLSVTHAVSTSISNGGVGGSSSSSSGPSATLSPFINLNAQLDADTVLQVARALSQEIVLEKLLSEVMRIITENTSADFVCLAMAKEGRDDLEIVSSKYAGTLRSARQTTTLATADRITAEIIRFVHTLNEGMLLENAYLDPRFVPEGRPVPGLVRSVLCVPISKGSVKAVLYLENSTVASAFSPARMQIVHAILPQIAISIENAQLVKSLTLASEELKRKNEALRQDDVRKDQFLAVTTHELRTPLHGVIGATSLLLETSPLSSEQQEYASVILGASKSLLTLVNDILDLTKIQSSKIRIEQRTVSVISIIESALEVVSGGAAEKELELAYVLGNSLPATHLFCTDPVRVQQVLTNLLANAIKFTPKGYVLLTVSAEGTSDQDTYLKFVVKDTGIGIPPDKIPRLFKMFAQLDAPETSRYDGYGVGLFICQRLLDLLGGTVTAESDGKSGSTFTVCIPASPVPCPVQPRLDSLPPNLAVVLYFAQRHSYAFMEPPLRRAQLNVHSLLSLEHLHELLAKISPGDRIVYFTDLALARDLHRALPADRVSLGTVVLAYPQKWKQYPTKAGLSPLFRPVQHGKIVAAVLALLPSPRPSLEAASFPTLDVDPSTSLVASTSFTRSTAALAAAANTPMAESPRKLHVLVVEDNLVNSKLLCRILEGTYTTATAINGVEAIKAVAERLPDLVLMDIQMPVMDGIAATKELRRLRHTFPIVAATASFTDSDRAMCLAAGMDDILPKPFTKPAVLAAVLRNLRKPTT